MLTNLRKCSLQMTTLENLIFVCKSWPNDPTGGCKSTSNLVEFMEKDLKLKRGVWVIWRFIWMRWSCECHMKLWKKTFFILFIFYIYTNFGNIKIILLKIIELLITNLWKLPLKTNWSQIYETQHFKTCWIFSKCRIP